MLGFCVLAPVDDAIAKLLGDTVPLALLLAVRYAMQALVLVPFCLLTGRPLGLSPRLLRLTALRTLLHVAALGTFFAALRYLPLADAVAIAFVMPFILLLLGRFVARRGGRPPPPRRLRRRLRRHPHGDPAELRRRRRPRAPAARDRAPLLPLHAGHPPDRPRRRPGDAPGRERRHGHPRPRCRSPPSGPRPTCPGHLRRRLADPPRARRPRHRRAPAHDLVAALRPLGDARADAVPRDPLRHPPRLAGLRRPARTASPPSASPSPSPPASTSSTASARASLAPSRLRSDKPLAHAAPGGEARAGRAAHRRPEPAGGAAWRRPIPTSAASRGRS